MREKERERVFIASLWDWDKHLGPEFHLLFYCFYEEAKS